MNRSTALSALILLGAGAHAQSQEKAISAKYGALAVAVKKAKLPAVEKWLSENLTKDFTYVDKSKRLYSSKDLRVTFRALFEGVKSIDVATYKVVRSQTNARTISVTLDSVLRSKSKLGRGPELTVVEVKSRTNDIWVKVGKEWKLSRKSTLSETQTFDGQPLTTWMRKPRMGRV